MGLRGWIKRLERDARGNLSSFVLEDGSRHYFNPESGECFRECIRVGSEGKPLPELPKTIKALTRARNRAAALEATCVGGLGLFPYEGDALIERGELVPAQWIHPTRDLSE